MLHLRTDKNWEMKIKPLPGNPLSLSPLEHPSFLELPGEANTEGLREQPMVLAQEEDALGCAKQSSAPRGTVASPSSGHQ